MEPLLNADFSEVVQLIEVARKQAYQAVNTTLIELYWSVGAYISNKLKAAEWGDGVVKELAHYLAITQPTLKGFTRTNLFRMRQFYETYHENEKVSPLVRQLPWTHNLIILSQSKRPEEREFYLKMAIQEKWSKRELERQFKAALFERMVLNPVKVSTMLREIYVKNQYCHNFSRHSHHPIRHFYHPIRHCHHSIRHSRAGGNPSLSAPETCLDSRLRGNDEISRGNNKINSYSTVNFDNRCRLMEALQ